ncbi:MAG: transposase [Thermodesulfobacteriota bacterium]|nr:transposase [Thermodesulfobacteriota bacterium]
MQYRRARTEGGSYFFTVVTHRRRQFLCEPENILLLRKIFTEIKQNHPFSIDAIVILPDHIHSLWTLPAGDSDYSTRWRLIKSEFSRQCKQRFKGKQTTSRQKKKEQAVWQRRFWEHEIQNEMDFQNHANYIHYNPVKHALAATPADWPYSSFQSYVDRGLYPSQWGAGKPMEFGSGVGQE